MASQQQDPPQSSFYSMLSLKQPADQVSTGGVTPFLSLGSTYFLRPAPSSTNEEPPCSILSISTTAAAAAEGSGSNCSSTALPQPPSKRLRQDTAAMAPPPAARFKGVVLQQNGHWGAQIYAHHSRIWLGTFKTERAAAMAYDSAAIKLHRCDTHRNFPVTESTAYEPGFQSMFSTDVVLDMIRDGSYEARFAEYLRLVRSPPATDAAARRPAAGGPACWELFQKELTPSDVGKLNRLVIPKKHAVRCLPEVSAEANEEVLVTFVDGDERQWEFRYCYWKSSQSYVFTKGWNKFVKEKGLKAKDVVAFYQCEEKDGLRRAYRLIGIFRGDGGEAVGDNGGKEVVVVVAEEEEDGEVMSGSTLVHEGRKEKEVKLFGVCIS